MEPIMLLFVLLFLVMCSAFYAASEIAIVSLPQIDIVQIKKRSKKIGERLDFHRKNAQRFVINISIANNFINILASSLATATMIMLFPEYGILIATFGMTFIILLFGEIIPKVLAITYTRQIAERSATALWISAKILSPIIYLFTIIVKLIAKGDIKEDPVTSDAIKYYVNKSHESGSIDFEEKEYINNVLNLDQISTKQIMTPKRKVLLMSSDMNVNDALKKFIESGFSRVPVYKDDKDNIIGVLHLKDLMLKSMDSRIGDYMREPRFIPGIRKVDDVLADFRKEKNHLGIVINSEGHFDGIITLEDLLEEIVGEIYDESDIKKQSIKKVGVDTFEMFGFYELAAFNKKFKTDFRGPHSIGGYLIEYLKYIPKKGERVNLPIGTFEIIDADKTRIKLFKFIVNSK